MIPVMVMTSDFPGRIPCEMVKTGLVGSVPLTETTPAAAAAPLSFELTTLP